jgi:alkylated DNA repair dioxygenase AlkB
MQANLFTNQSDPHAFETHELGDGWIREYPCFLSDQQASTLLGQLLDSIPWQQDQIRIAGRLMPVPRLQCWMGDGDYSYSGIRLQALAWHSSVLALKQGIEAVTGRQFNSVLLNYYRNGQDSVAWHADDEPELGPEPVIASLSLGAERPFRLRPKAPENSDRRRILLRNGSLLLMGEGIQNNWLHELPKVKGLEMPRLNLTFRQVIKL